MLRRNQTTTATETVIETLPPSPPVAEPSFAPKVERRGGERRGGDRRGMDALRDEALRNVISRVEDRNFKGLRTGARVRLGGGMKPARIILLLVAMLAGGMAAFLATQREQPAAQTLIAQPAAQIVRETRTQILVAKEAIGVGQRLSPGSVQWQDWPQGSVLPDYITVASAPNAPTEMTSAVARFEIFPGEPIREQKLVHADQGYLSAVLDSGERGVSVSVTADSASGGFIVPNDHVDVVLAHATSAGPISQTILHNVRVLAINTRLGETGKTGAPADPSDPHAEIFAGQAIATLELDPTQSEVIINAGAQGKLSLVLRSLTDSAEVDKVALSPANQAIRMTSPFWSK